MVKYKKNYLNQVVARVDFLSPINSINRELPSEIISVIKDFFPIAEPQEVLEIGLQLGKEAPEKQSKIMQWKFLGKEREKELDIDEKSMFIVFKNYKSFEDLQIPFIRITDSLFNTYKDIQTKRLGLRYINRIDISENYPLNWRPYINKELLSVFNIPIPEDKLKIARVLQFLELNYGNFMLRFGFGMHNPDYPAQIKKKIFTLDYDASYEGFLNKEEISEKLPIFHSEIKKFFELSITDKLRKKMNDEK